VILIVPVDDVIANFGEKLLSVPPSEGTRNLVRGVQEVHGVNPTTQVFTFASPLDARKRLGGTAEWTEREGLCHKPRSAMGTLMKFDPVLGVLLIVRVCGYWTRNDDH